MSTKTSLGGESRELAGSQQPKASAPVWQRLLRFGSELGSDWHPVRGGGPQADAPPEPTALGEAEIVEDDGAFTVRDVGHATDSQFQFFLDGIEHTRICGYVDMVPLIHGYVAAVIRQRTDRVFTTWAVIEEEVLAFPFQLIDRERFIEVGLPKGALINSDRDDVAAHRTHPTHPIRMAEEGRIAIKRQRAGIERRLARRWVKAALPNGWLLVDGGLAIDPGLLQSGRAIGLVKSHRTQFLEPASMHKVLNMNRGVRSSVFKPVRPKVGEVHSWYLRLRSSQNHDIYWALARIEAQADQGTVDIADEVSRWLLAETAPLALPDPSWHVLLYPIRDCEQYLRARMPTLDVG